MRTFHIVKALAAPPELVWDVLADYPGMTKWAGARSVDIERPGVDVPNGVGTIRALRSWHGTIREEITGFEPERRMSYKGLTGVPSVTTAASSSSAVAAIQPSCRGRSASNLESSPPQSSPS
jgi:uncharacterized protein YndB with AHSA1/START domain